MPPPVALCLFLVLTAWLLVRDVRRRPSVGAAIWIPTLLLIVIGSRPLSLWFGASPSDYPEGNPIDRFFYLSLIIGAWLITLSRRVKWTELFTSNATITMFYVYLALSVLWSDDPGGSSKRWFKEFGNLAVVAIILSETDPLEAIRAVYVRCACVLIPISVLFIRYFPDWGRSYSRGGEQFFTGIATQKNSLGEIVMTFSLFVVWDHLEARAARAKRFWTGIAWDRLLLLIMGVWLLHISDSMTALMCLLIGVAMIVRSERFASVRINRLMLLGALCLPFLLFFEQQFISTLTPLLEALGRDPTFTGRTDIWRNVLADTRTSLLFGAGFFSFWGGQGGEAVRQVMQAPGLHSAHNGYLDIYVDGGLIGLGLLFCLLLAQGKRLLGSQQMDRFGRLRFAVLIVAIVYNLSEATFARLTPIWFTTLLVLIDFRFAKAAAESHQSAGVSAMSPAAITRRPEPVRQFVYRGRMS